MAAAAAQATGPGAGWVSRSHRAIAPFRLHRPGTVEEAVRLLAERGSAWPMAGGIDVVARLRDGAAPGDIVWLAGIEDLDAIGRAEDTLRIGPTVTHRRIETDRTVAGARPDLAAAWRTVGNVRVRMAGTIGGNLMAGHPNYDGPVILAAAGARLRFSGPEGEGAIGLGVGSALRQAQDEAPERTLLTAVEIPLGGGRRVLFDRSLKPAVSAAVGLEAAGDGETVIRAAVGCAYPAPVTVTVAGTSPSAADTASSLAAQLPEPAGDAIAGAAYRRKMAGVLMRRLLERLLDGGEPRP